MTADQSVAPQINAQLSPPTKFQSALWWAILLFLFVSTFSAGSIGAVLSLIPALVAVPFVLNAPARALLLRQKENQIFLVVFFVLAAVFAITAQNLSDMKYVINFISFLLVIPIFWLARKHAGGKWPLVIAFVALLGVVLALLQGLVEVGIFGQRRATGLVNNANMFGHIAILFGFFSLVGINLTKRRWRYIFLLGPVLGVLTTMLSGSRGSLVAAIPVVIIAVFYVAFSAQGRRWILAAATILLLGVVAFSYSTGWLDRQMSRVIKTQGVVMEVLETGESSEWSTNMRVGLYRGAIQAFLDSPIVGHGWARAVEVSAKDIPGRRPATNRLNASIASGWPHVHNDILGFAAGAGILGILCYLTLMWSPFVSLRRRDIYWSHRLYFALILVSFTMVHGLFDAPFGYDIGVITYSALVAIIAGTFYESGAPVPARQ